MDVVFFTVFRRNLNTYSVPFEVVAFLEELFSYPWLSLEPMATFLVVEQKNFYGDIVTPNYLISEDVGVLVTTRDEKKAPPKKTRLQKGHCKSCEFVSL